MEEKLSYERTFAINSRNVVIARLKGGGFAIVYAGEKKAGMEIQISDFAMSFLKFDAYRDYKKVEAEENVPAEIRANAKYNLENCGIIYGEIRHLKIPEGDLW